ncbi:YlqD family protein [Thermincola potens]|uniref:YlqD protein n=1 Tax=Thermincola potens (strain JR) TaxID=635013 RepID=D5X8L7_THEPJ|nr:conserved hypothetical protein [Thermincola potens JR]
MLDNLTILRQVTVKAKVTEKFKNTMAAQIQDAIRKIDLELQNIDFQLKRTVAELEKQNPAGIPAAKKHFQDEREKRTKAREQLTEQIKQIGKLAIGSEIIQGTLDTLAEIKVGDNWQDIFNVEVVVCDDRIIEIRRRTTGNGTGD